MKCCYWPDVKWPLAGSVRPPPQGPGVRSHFEFPCRGRFQFRCSDFNFLPGGSGSANCVHFLSRSADRHWDKSLSNRQLSENELSDNDALVQREHTAWKSKWVGPLGFRG